MLGQFLSEPNRQIFTEAAKIDEMFANFGEVKTVSLKQNVEGIHSLALRDEQIDSYENFIPASLRIMLPLPICLNIFLI